MRTCRIAANVPTTRIPHLGPFGNSRLTGRRCACSPGSICHRARDIMRTVGTDARRNSRLEQSHRTSERRTSAHGHCHDFSVLGEIVVSRPSGRQRGSYPPLVEIGHMWSDLGKVFTSTSNLPMCSRCTRPSGRRRKIPCIS